MSFGDVPGSRAVLVQMPDDQIYCGVELTQQQEGTPAAATTGNAAQVGAICLIRFQGDSER